MTNTWVMHGLLVAALGTATIAIQRPGATRFELGIILVWALLWIGRWMRRVMTVQAMTRQTTTTVAARDEHRWRTIPAALYLGSGFAWTAQHVTTLLDYLRIHGAFPDGSEARGGTPLLHGVGSIGARTIHLSMDDLGTHVNVQGATQTGKSSVFRLLGRQIIPRAEGPVVLIDPRPELLLFKEFIAAAHRADRPVALIDPGAYLTQSRMFNPLSTCTDAAQVVERIQPFFPESREEFFETEVSKTLLAILTMQKAVNEPWTLKDMERATLVPSARWALVRNYLAYKGVDTNRWPSVVDEGSQIIGYIRRVEEPDSALDRMSMLIAMGEEHVQHTHNNLSSALSGLTDTSYAHLFDHQPTALTWQDIEENNTVLIVLTRALEIGKAGSKIARLVIQDLVGHAARRYNRPNPKQQPITAFVDEIGEAIYPAFASGVINKVAGAGIRFVMACQTQADVEAEIGRELASVFFTNVQTRIWLRAPDTASQREASHLCGTCDLLDSSDAMTMSIYGRDTGDASMRKTNRFVQRPRVEPDWFGQLPVGEAFALVRGRLLKLSFPILEDPDDDAVRAAGFGALRTVRSDEAPGDTLVPVSADSKQCGNGTHRNGVGRESTGTRSGDRECPSVILSDHDAGGGTPA